MKRCDCREHKDGEIMHIMFCHNRDQVYSWEDEEE